MMMDNYPMNDYAWATAICRVDRNELLAWRKAHQLTPDQVAAQFAAGGGRKRAAKAEVTA